MRVRLSAHESSRPQDGEFFDEQLRLLREAHAAAEADADARMPRAKRATQILTSSKWRHEMEGVASPMLEALLVDEPARRPPPARI